MNFADLFDPNFKPRILAGGSSVELTRQVQERNAIERRNNQPVEEESGLGYVKYFRQKMAHQRLVKENQNSLMEIDVGSTIPTEASTFYGDDDNNNLEDDDCNYNNYNLESKHNLTELPIDHREQDILNLIDACKVVIIEGTTGCGKSTRVPQFILDSCVKKNRKCRIVVTQPRRLGVVSVATRVAKERDWKLGEWVGYQIGQAKTFTDQTRILYCTTGVLLERLVGQKSLLDYTHIILDEVHEREQDMDFLLIVIKKLLTSAADTCVRIILMSATINSQTFSKYLDVCGHGLAPIIKIGPKTNYKVAVSYLNELHFINPRPILDFNEPKISSDGFNAAVMLISKLDIIEAKHHGDIGSVLVFLPGIREIEELFERLLKQGQMKNFKWSIKVLHSSITSIEQETVFEKAEPGYRKIILSTNIAESSVTIPDIRFVIDFCLTKELMCDEGTDYSSLKLCWASKSNCTQRLGRAGRTADGYCFRLINEHDFKSFLSSDPTPEIQRMPLNKLVLNVKILNMGSPQEILSIALDQPDIRNIRRTIYSLKEIGALLPITDDGKYTEYDGDITFLGRMISRLPVDIHLGKLIFLGYVFGVLDETIIIASAMSKSNLFSTPFQKDLESYCSKLEWADRSNSDCIMFLNAYQSWRKRTTDASFTNRDNLNEKQWAERNFIQIKSLREISRIETDIRQRLEYQGILYSTSGNIGGNTGSRRFIVPDIDRPLILKVVIAGAFYPNYFVRSSLGGQIDECDAIKTLCGHDPNSTVYFKGLPNHQHGSLYWGQLNEKLKKPLGENIYFSADSSKIFVHCKPVGLNEEEKKLKGRISLGVYKAVKLRQTMKNFIQIQIYNLQDAIETKQQLDLQYTSNKKFLEPDLNIPWPWNSNSKRILLDIRFYVVYFENISKFWIQSANFDHILRDFRNNLNELDGNLIPVGKIQIDGKLYAANYKDTSGDVRYYRCRLMAINNDSYTVYYVDYGNTEIIPKQNLKDFGPNLLEKKFDRIPDLALECKLAKISPKSDMNGELQKWPDEANNLFEKKFQGYLLKGKIYSFFDGIILLKIFNNSNLMMTMKTLNKELIKLNLVEPAEELYIYRLNHEELKRYDRIKDEIIEKEKYEDNDEDWKKNMNSKNCCPKLKFVDDMKKLDLKGPYSPLEMDVYSLIHCNKGKRVQIEFTSVNSVLLDTDPHDPHERMATAGYVHVRPNSGVLALRDVTLMPNIHGFSSLMCLLFSPMIELRTDKRMTKYIGAICGLGYHPKTKTPIHRINDMEIIFDCKIDKNILMEINKLRNLFNQAMVFSFSSRQDNIIFREQKQVNELLKKIIKPKESQDLVIFDEPFKWNQIPVERYLVPLRNMSSQSNPAEFRKEVYKLIWGIVLDADVPMMDSERRKILKELEDIANGLRDMPKGGMVCKICNVPLDNMQNLRIHKRELEHKKRAGLFTPSSSNSNSLM